MSSESLVDSDSVVVRHLGRVGAPIVVSFPGEPSPLVRVPSVCSTWDKPGPIELTRLRGLDLEDCAILLRTTTQAIHSITTASIEALLSARISCVGIDGTLGNRRELLDAGLVVIERLALHDLPRAGFCLTVDGEATAFVRPTPWLS